MKAVIVRLSSIGDVVHTLPTLAALRDGRVDQPANERPVLITETADGPDELPCTAVRDVILSHILDRV